MLYEVDLLKGLKPIAISEISATVLGAEVIPGDDAESIVLRWDGDAQDLLQLRTVVAVSQLLEFAVPRPKGLLGHEHLTRIVDAVKTVRDSQAADPFNGFRISAAGSDSSVLTRFAKEISAATALPYLVDGDLVIRVRPYPQGWQVLVRITRRPLSTRDWRVVDFPGALNATIAAAMVQMSRPKVDRVLNVTCGSGTLIIERLLHSPAAQAVACDTDAGAIEATTANVKAAGLDDAIKVRNGDVRELPFADGAFDVVFADPPWGQLQGSHGNNVELYPLMLQELARVIAAGGRALIISHEVQLMERALAAEPRLVEEESLTVFAGGLHPRIHLLRRCQ